MSSRGRGFFVIALVTRPQQSALAPFARVQRAIDPIQLGREIGYVDFSSELINDVPDLVVQNARRVLWGEATFDFHGERFLAFAGRT